MLVGCPGTAYNAAAGAIVEQRGGKIVSAAEGVTLVSIPQDNANVGMAGG